MQLPYKKLSNPVWGKHSGKHFGNICGKLVLSVFVFLFALSQVAGQSQTQAFTNLFKGLAEKDRMLIVAAVPDGAEISMRANSNDLAQVCQDMHMRAVTVGGIHVVRPLVYPGTSTYQKEYTDAISGIMDLLDTLDPSSRSGLQRGEWLNVAALTKTQQNQIRNGLGDYTPGPETWEDWTKKRRVAAKFLLDPYIEVSTAETASQTLQPSTRVFLDMVPPPTYEMLKSGTSSALYHAETKQVPKSKTTDGDNQAHNVKP